MAKIEKRIYQSVSALSTATLEYTPTSGQPVTILEAGGGAPYSLDAVVKIVWDYGGANEVLFSTSGDAKQNPTELMREGNGTKKIAIVLTNNMVTAANMGGYWIGIV